MNVTGTIWEMSTQETNDLAGELARCVSCETVVRRDEPLAKHTTLRVGGPADVYVEPAAEPDLAGIVKRCGARGVSFCVIGRGSNLIVRDGGFRGVVICLAHPGFSRIEICGTGILPVSFCGSRSDPGVGTHGQDARATRLRCGAGAKLKSVAVEAKRNGLSGVEFLEGIPGSVGGALRMNAGAMGGQTFDAVESVRVMDFNGSIRELALQEMAVEYRACATLKNHIALGAVFKCKPAPRAEIEARMKAFSERRWASQPAAPSAGCMFKNPETIPAGKLVDELGLKGARVGGAMVSAEHGNFIVNDGSATARDILELIELVKKMAKAERGIDLPTEVEIIGEE